MDYLSLNDPLRQWPVVSKEDFDKLLAAINYRRAAWSDVVIYSQPHTLQLFGYHVIETGEYHIHPDWQ